MEKRKMIILDIDYITHEERPVVRLLGKEKGDETKDIIALDSTFVPYLYVVPSKDIYSTLDELNEFKTNGDLNFEKIEIVDKKDFQIHKKFIKISFKHPQEVPKYRDTIWGLDSVKELREHDIPFYRRYLVDNDLIPMTEVEVSGELIDSFPTITSKNESLEIMKLIEAPKTIATDFQDFRMMSFDLEVRNPHGMPNSQENEIIMIGIDSNFGIRKVISTKGQEFADEEGNLGELDFIDIVNSEKEMIQTFVNIVKENNVDIIIGYNSDNFDFPYLKDRAKLLNVDLDMGMDGSGLKFLRRGFANAATLKGVLHVDLYLVMRRYMSLDRYTLERVYLELFGEEKIDVPGEKIYQFWDNGGEELRNLFKYSLDDVVATLKIAEQTLPLNLELTRIVGQPFFDVTRMATGQQAEWYLVRQAYELNEVIPNKPSMSKANLRERGSNSGGYVKEPEIGLHENLVQFDFRSLYPSLIISKNISPDVLVKDEPSLEDGLLDENYLGEESLNDGDLVIGVSNSLGGDLAIAKDDDSAGEKLTNEDDEYYICPEHFHKFKKEPQGFIPSVMGNILSERVKIKNQMKASEDPVIKKSLDVQQQALKRLANTMYGIYGFSRFRWYSFECAQAITAWGRQHIKQAMAEAEAYGFYAIYADTDGFYAKYRSDIDCINNN